MAPKVNINDKRQIIMAMVVVGGIVAARSWVNDETPDPRILWGIPLAAVIFSVIAEFAPEFGGALAMLMLVSAVFIGGPEVWRGLTKAIRPKE